MREEKNRKVKIELWKAVARRFTDSSIQEQEQEPSTMNKVLAIIATQSTS